MKYLAKAISSAAIAHHATILECIGTAVLLAGLWMVWHPLPFVIGGAGTLGLGILLDYLERASK